MKGNCEVFEKDKCFGCIGLAQDNIDEVKKMCETYREEMYYDRGEQMKWS